MRKANPFGNLCLTCRKKIQQPARGRTRCYCNPACRQKWYRRMHGKYGRIRRKPPVTPLYERRLDATGPVLVHRLSEVSAVYRCVGCRTLYVVERLKGGRISKYCSKACMRHYQRRLKRLDKAICKADVEGHLNEEVFARQMEGKLSPLCAHCGQPFPPKFGQGRKRKYCSPACRKAAYEKRYENAHEYKRRHRWRNCAHCGQRMDREDRMGRRIKRFCSKECTHAAASRAYKQRKRKAELREREHARTLRWLRKQKTSELRNQKSEG